MKLIESLMKTGLTKNESELYLALCREGEITGYEAAKVTGIPRANAYQGLSGLVDKGAAYLIEGNAQRYTAVPVGEYCENVLRSMKKIIAEIIRDCPIIKKESEPYITIAGFHHIVDKMKNIINGSKERIYISLTEGELKYIREELAAAIDRGLKVVVITSGDINLHGAKVHVIDKKSGQIRLIADTSHVLTGEITGSEGDSCLYSKNRPLVELIRDSLKNEIRLAEMEERNEY